jgi:drug/metabolite transporter (DMT)-like permease
MVLVTLLWSTAGVVTRQLERAEGLEVTFLRSGFNALALVLILSAWRGPRHLWRSLCAADLALWLSGLCWATMFTAFMLALSLTSVANVLVTMAVAPLLTALGARVWLGFRLSTVTWVALGLAGLGIAIMFGGELGQGSRRDVSGMLVALGVPLASATNWLILQRFAFAARPKRSAVQPATGRPKGADDQPDAAPQRDFLPAVLIGALLSTLVSLPLAWPIEAAPRDVAWLAALGCFQLALPCLLMVSLARTLPGPELALLALLEVLFGVLLVWWIAGEAPRPAALWGGALVLVALLGNELLGLWHSRLPAGAQPANASNLPPRGEPAP